MQVVDECYRVCGSWMMACAAVGITPSKMRRIRDLDTRCLTRNLYERFCAVVDGDPDEVNWYTAEELVELGYWSPLYGTTWGEHRRKHGE